MGITILHASGVTSPAVKALTHTIRRDVIDCVARGLTTPSEMAADKGHQLGVVSYHVRMLCDYGVLELARSRLPPTPRARRARPLLPARGRLPGARPAPPPADPIPRRSRSAPVTTTNPYYLASGKHANPADGRCAMEWVAYLAGEPHSEIAERLTALDIVS